MADLLRPDDYEPKEQFSPSGLGLASMCEMAWFYRYVLGQKESDLLSWADAKDLERPEKPPASSPAAMLAAHREDVKEFNRLTRRALGHAIHDVLYIHYDWHPPLSLIDWTDRPGAVAIAGLPFLPAHEELAEAYPEQELELAWGPDEDPIKVWGFADLIVRMFEEGVKVSDVEVYAPGAWVLIDYKTTYNFDWIPLREELEQDVAACFYALACMVKLELAEMPCRWVYFLTDEQKPEDARAVTFTITREQAIKVLTPVETLAERLRDAMRAYVALGNGDLRCLGLKHNPVHCENIYGSRCVYHFEQGGDCRPPRATTGQRMTHLHTRETMLRKRREFNATQRNGQSVKPRKSRGASPGQARRTATASRSARHVTADTTNERKSTMGKFNQEAAAGAPAENGAAPAAAPRTRAPRQPRAAAAAEQTPPLYLLAGDDVKVEIPVGSPLHKRAVAVLEALYAE